MVLIAVATVSLSGCTPAAKEKKLQQETSRLTSGLTAGFKSSMDLQYKNIRATATLDQQTPGNYKITFSEPPAMKGMIITTEGEMILIQYHSLSARFTADEFFDSSAASMVVSTINTVTAQEGMEVAIEDGCLTLSGQGIGNTGNGMFTVKIDRKNGNLINLTFPEQEFQVDFKDFKFLS